MLIVWAAGCVRSQPPPKNAAALADSPDVHSREIEKLRGLAYIDYAPEPADEIQGDGVVEFEREQTWPGYTLCTQIPLGLAELIDAEGRVVNAWQDTERTRWLGTELMSNGDLLVVRVVGEGDKSEELEGYVQRLSWDNRVIWRRPLPVHHDIEVTPQGRILTLTKQRRAEPDVQLGREMWDNSLTLLDHDGQVLEEVSFLEAFRAAPHVQRLPDRRGRRDEEILDVFHSNSVEWMPYPELAARDPLYSRNHVLVACRNLNAIAIIDWDRRAAVWSWGPGVVSGVHSASLLSDGHILLFDNGVNRKWSRVIEIDPLSREIVWEYQATPAESFFSARQGSCQRLPNGNTLVCSSEAGEVLEVTGDHVVVWRYLNPHKDKSQHRCTLLAQRYGGEPIEQLLQSRKAKDK